MILFVELCVDLKKGKLAKDGLYQYKNTAQNTNVGTIEVGLRSPGHSPFFLSFLTDQGPRLCLACSQEVHRTCGAESYRSPSKGGCRSILSRAKRRGD